MTSHEGSHYGKLIALVSCSEHLGTPMKQVQTKK